MNRSEGTLQRDGERRQPGADAHTTPLSGLKLTALALSGLFLGGAGALERERSETSPASNPPAKTASFDPSRRNAGAEPIDPCSFEVSEKLNTGLRFPDLAWGGGELNLRDRLAALGKLAKVLGKDPHKAALEREALDAIEAKFDLAKLELVERAPGLIEFRAEHDGRERRIVAFGKDLFVVSAEPGERETRELAKVRARLNEMETQRHGIEKELQKWPQYDSDYYSARWSGLQHVDTAHMPEEARKRVEAAAKLVNAEVALRGEIGKLEEVLQTRTLTRIGSEPEQRVIMLGGPGKASTYELVHLGKDGKPERWTRIDSDEGPKPAVDITAAVRALGKNDDETHSAVARLGSFAAPRLRDLLEGRLEAPAKEKDAAHMVAAIMLAGLNDNAAIEPLFKVVRGQVRASHGNLKPFSVDDAVLGLGPAAVPQMLRALEDRSPKVRALAARYFQKYPDERALEPLRGMLEDSEKPAKRHAAIALGVQRDPASVEPLISLLEHNVPGLSAEAAMLLACQPGKRAFDALKECLRDPVIAAHAARGAGRSNDPAMVPELRAHAVGESPVVEVLPGLMRWAARGKREAEEGLILGSYNPDGSKQYREALEVKLISLSPASGKRLRETAKDRLESLPKSAPEWQKRAYETFLSAREHGIEFLNRIPEEHRAEILKNRREAKRDDRPLSIMIGTRGDKSGAFYHSNKIFDGLIKNGYRVMYYEVESDEELATAMKSAAARGTKDEQKASIVVFGGHGSQQTLMLQRDNVSLPDMRGFLDVTDLDMLVKAGVPECLAKDGQIILDSCCNGAGKGEADGKEGRPLNMTNFIRKLFPQAKERGIWSATESYGPIELIFDKEKRLIDVRFPVPEYRALGDDRAALRGDERAC